MTSDRLSEAADRTEIRQLLHGFLATMDAKRFDEIGVFLTEDAEFDSPRFGIQVGPEAIAETCRRALGHIDHVQHACFNEIITLDGDAAQLTSYLHTYHEHDGRNFVIRAGLYEEYRRTSQGWKITLHRARRVWMEGDGDLRHNPDDVESTRPI